MDRKRLLWVGESSFLSTGYATYGMNLLKYLYNTGKYEITELGSYGTQNDPRQSLMPWRFIGNLPDENNPKEQELYLSNPTNQFGEWKFEHTCIQVSPQICLDVRDPWMMQYELSSPFRRMYNLTWLAPCDSLEQNESWLYDYSQVDGVFTYNNWSERVLNQEGGGKINVLGAVPPGVELDLFKPPVNKAEHKAKFGIQEDTFILGSTMRNQKRKLIPDLMLGFSELLKRLRPEQSRKTFLYLHTAYPDLGYDLVKLIKNYGLSTKVLLTYTCSSCGLVFPAFYSDVRCICPKCNGANATMPNTQRGIDRPSLSEVYKLFDVFIQYAVCEGFGLPQVEATACGIPLFSVDYSAMSDVVRKVEGYPIKVERFFHESETGCTRALPSNEDLVKNLLEYMALPDSIKVQKSFKTRALTEKYYNWPATCRKWEQYIDSVQIRPDSETWLSPPHIIPPVKITPELDRLTNEQFVNWALMNVMGRPELIGSYFAHKIIRDLSWGAQPGQNGGMVFSDLSTLGEKPNYQEYNRSKVIEQFKQVAHKNNFWEQKRYDTLVLKR